MPRRILLVNPPVYDTKFPWARWQEPTLLRKVSTFMKARGDDVRYLDTLAARHAPLRLKRQRSRIFNLDDTLVNQWRFGESIGESRMSIRALQEVGWIPDVVIIECSASFWWRGTREIACITREAFPEARIGIVGPRAALEFAGPADAEGEGRDAWVRAEKLIDLPFKLHASQPDWSLGRPPAIGYLSFVGGIRSPAEIVDDIGRGVAAGVGLFAFAESAILHREPEAFGLVLEEVVRSSIRAAFVAPGTISAQALLDNPELIPLMRRAGYRQIFFADDRDMPLQGPSMWSAENSLLNAYKTLVPLCIKAGFQHRSDSLVAGLSVGRPREDLRARAAFATRLANVVGSVIVWPYQPSPIECAMHGVPAREEIRNGKLFPLRHTSGATYRDFLNLMGLTVVLNSKYREQTFDFLGTGIIASLFRRSLLHHAWEPDSSVKGSLRLPAPSRDRALETQTVDAATAV